MRKQKSKAAFTSSSESEEESESGASSKEEFERPIERSKSKTSLKGQTSQRQTSQRQTSQIADGITCPNGHKMRTIYDRSDIPDYEGDANCDKCGKNIDLDRIDEMKHCDVCEYDMCEKCLFMMDLELDIDVSGLQKNKKEPELVERQESDLVQRSELATSIQETIETVEEKARPSKQRQAVEKNVPKSKKPMAKTNLRTVNERSNDNSEAELDVKTEVVLYSKDVLKAIELEKEKIRKRNAKLRQQK